MQFEVLTLFPEIFSGYLTQSLLHKAIQKGLVSVRLHNLRDWAEGRHQQVDDRPYGGGPGMVLMVEPVIKAVEAVQALSVPIGAETEGRAVLPPAEVILLTPSGERLNQRMVEELAVLPRMLLLCGRYEGFDQRVMDLLRPREVSIGDYVLNGGEVAERMEFTSCFSKRSSKPLAIRQRKRMCRFIKSFGRRCLPQSECPHSFLCSMRGVKADVRDNNER